MSSEEKDHGHTEEKNESMEFALGSTRVDRDSSVGARLDGEDRVSAPGTGIKQTRPGGGY